MPSDADILSVLWFLAGCLVGVYLNGLYIARATKIAQGALKDLAQELMTECAQHIERQQVKCCDHIWRATKEAVDEMSKRLRQ